MPHREWLKAQNIFAKLPEMRKMLLELEKRVSLLDKPEEKRGIGEGEKRRN